MSAKLYQSISFWMITFAIALRGVTSDRTRVEPSHIAIAILGASGMRANAPIRLDPRRAGVVGRRYAMADSCTLLTGCAETRGEKWRDDAALNLRIAQQQWSECSANPTCTGDEMFKARANLADAQIEYGRADAQVHAEYAILQSSMDQMNQSVSQMNTRLYSH